MNPRVEISVIIPCYNAERYLPICLESLKIQEDPVLEMIFIDDGSQDATGRLLEEFAEHESRAIVIHTENKGVSAARNLGLDYASGKYIAFVDADDVLEERAFNRLYQMAVRTGAQITSANHTLFDDQNGCRIPICIEPVVQQPSEIVKEIIHMHRIYNNLWNKLYMRELFDNDLRLDERVSIGEDALLNMQLYLRARKVTHLNEKTYVYRVHEHSAMASIGGYRQAHEPMLMCMNELLIRAGIKELYFRDFLQSCIWMSEKEEGIRKCMDHFDEDIVPLVLDGLCEDRIPKGDKHLLSLIHRKGFARFYKMMRVRERITGKKWGIRR